MIFITTGIAKDVLDFYFVVLSASKILKNAVWNYDIKYIFVGKYYI